jgi:DNA invertase Pin-like site-specific DNA recombinase
MAEGAFVAHYRVSTERQGRSGLGLAARRKAVEDFLNGGNWRLVAEFTEIESGKQADRPALAKAFQACRLRRAKLVIAKLDRLSRDAHFLLGLEKAGVDFVAADMPTANRLTAGIRTGRNLRKEEWAHYIGSDTPRRPNCRDRPSNWRTQDP